MSPLRRCLALALVTLSLSFGVPAAAQDGPLTVFAAASLKNVMDEQGAAFRKAGGAEVRFSYGASSALARQIESGAPADLFVSADSDWMTYVGDRNLLKAGTRRDLLTNRLALIAPKDSKVKLTVARGMPLARTLGSGRLAMAAPEVPAGRYGRAALTSLGVWPSVEGKVASAENVRAALAYVSRGEAPLGVVYASDAKAEPKVKVLATFPHDAHPAIVYPVARVMASGNPGALDFVQWLQSPEAAQIFRAHGFTLL